MRGIIVSLIIFTAFSLTVNAQQHSGYKVKVNKYLKNNDSIDIDFEVAVYPYEVSNCESVLLDFFVEKDDHSAYFTPILVNGKLRKHTYFRSISLHRSNKEKFTNYEVFSAGNRQKEKVSYKKTLPYTEELDGAVLYVTQTIWDCGSRISQETFALGSLQIPQIKLQTPPAQIIDTVIPPAEPQLKSGIAYVDFPVGKSVLDLNFGNNKNEWNKIMDQLKEIQADNKSRIIGLEIIGYASPEGPYTLNEKLSYERAKTISEQIIRTANLSLSRNQIKVYSVAEDWDGLVELINDSYLPYKQEVLDIIATKGIFEGREKALMDLAHGTVYRTLLREFFPKLRRTEYKIIYVED